MRVLIVEDEVRLAETLRDLLDTEHYAADVCHDGESGLDNALSDIYDLVILDVMLPKKDGFSVLRALRQEGKTVPVLMLSARSELSDRVEGLDCGADDYLTKPFATEELLARVRALSRRQGEVVLEALEYGDLKLDLSTHDLRRGNRSVRLNRKEFDVLHLLMANSRIIVPKETLITKVWGYESNAEANNVEAYISFLRKKLIYLDSCVSIITLRKVGYRLEGGEA